MVATLIGLSFPVSSCTKAAKASRHSERADQYFKDGEYEEAKIEYMNVLRLDGINRRAIQRIGQIWWVQGSPIQAAPFLLRSRELDPNNTEVRLTLAQVFAAVGSKTEASKEALAALQQVPTSGEALLRLSAVADNQELLASAEEQLANFPQKEDAFYHLARANILLRKNDLAGAQESVAKALALDAKSSAPHSLMGVVHSLQNRPDLAREDFKTAADLAPLRSQLRIEYAAFLARTGDEKQAVAYLTDLTGKARDYLPAWNLLARLAEAAKDHDKASAYVKSALAQDSNNPETLLLGAEITMASGDAQGAIEQLERLAEKYPGSPVVKFQLARAYVTAGNPVQATLTLEQVLATNPDYPDAILLLAELDIKAAKPQPAITSLEKLYHGEPASPQVRRLLADAYRAAGRSEDAAALFRAQITSTPNFAEPYYFLGIVLRDQKKAEEARQAFTKASELEPDNPAPVEQLVELDLAEHKFDAARDRVQRQIEAKPNVAPAYFLMAKVYLAQKQSDLAEGALLKALELDPNLEVADRLLIASYIAARKFPEAAKRLERFLSKSPNNVDAMQTLAMAYSEMQAYEKARDVYERILVIKPDAALAMNNLAYLYAERFEQLDRAQDLATRARTLAPSEPRAAGTLGWILYKRGDYQQAVALLRESAEKLPENAIAQYHFGMASYMMGDTEHARTALQKAVSFAEDFPGKEDARKRLAILAPSAGAELTSADLEAAIHDHPNDIQALTQLAAKYEQQGDHLKAADAFAKVYQQNPTLLPPVLKLAELNAGPLKNPSQALDWAKKARELAPTDAMVAATLGTIAYRAHNFAWAYSLLQEAARARAEDAEVLHSFAWAAYSVGRVQEAEDTMRRVLAAAPTASTSEDAKLFLGFAQTERDSNGPASAAARADETLREKPDYVPALLVQAAVATQRDIHAAISIYEKVLTQFPDFAPAQKRLAAVLLSDPTQHERAYSLASTARKALPDDPELAATLARLSYLRKDYRRTVQLLQESERSRPLDALSLFCLGMSQAQLNQKPAARMSLEKALAATLPEAEAADAKRAIETLDAK